MESTLRSNRENWDSHWAEWLRVTGECQWKLSLHLKEMLGAVRRTCLSTLTQHEPSLSRLVFQSKNSFKAAEIKLPWSLVQGARCNLAPEKYQQWQSENCQRTTSEITQQSSYQTATLFTPSSYLGFLVLFKPKHISEWCISVARATKLTVRRTKPILVLKLHNIWKQNAFDPDD